MRGTSMLLQGLFVVAIGYLYPSVVVYRGGSVGPLIGKIWGILLVYIFTVCFVVPAAVSLFDPVFANKMHGEWVPDTPAVVPILFAGWTVPVLGGAIGYVIRRMSLALFPNWTRRISIQHQCSTE